MALADIQAAACTSGIGREINPVSLLQVIAQTSAETAEEVAGVSIDIDDIKSRACTSGIGYVTDEIELLQIIAQLLNDLQS